MASSSKKGNTKRQAPNKSEEIVENNPIRSEVFFVIVLVVALLIAISLFGWGGVVGRGVSYVLFGLFGAVSFFIPILLIFIGGFVILNSKNDRVRHKGWYGLGFFLTSCGLVQWFFNSDVKDVWDTFNHSATNHTRGGFFGGLLSFELSKLLGRVGDLILLLGLLLMFFILFSRKLLFSNMKNKVQDRHEQHKRATVDERDLADRQMQIHTFDSTMRQEAKEHVAPKKKEQSFAPKLEPDDESKVEKKRKNRRKKDMKDSAVLESVAPELPETDKERALQDVHIRGMSREDLAEDSGIAEKELEAKFGKGDEDAGRRTQSGATGDESDGRRRQEFTPSEPAEPLSQTNRSGSLSKSPTASRANGVPTASRADDDTTNSAASDGDKPKVPEPIPYEFPPVDLLSKPKAGSRRMSEKELKDTALKLQETLGSFGVGVSLGDISVGPSVTRYELIPDQGVKVSRITALADDIKLSLAASDIRIEAPIPGKSAVGIEVPNATRVTITLRELLESDEFQQSKSKLSFAVGKDISGKTIVTDIAKMPHVLVAGSTGSGKSVLINTMIMSIIFKADPNDVKMIMVDPKMVEFMAFAEIPHLMIPVVDDPKKASAALAWAVAEMEKRYKKFAELGIRDIATYNKKIEKMKVKDDPEYQKMPQIVIIVDEFADLMMVASHDVEDSVMRLAQKARAAGIHLVLATQRPSVNVITGVIKANIPSRIALSVSSQVDSRTIIDSVGAEKLLGNGDMLFAPQSLPQPIRVQGAFVSDDDRDKVVTFLKEHGGAAYDEAVTASIETVQADNSTDAAAAEAPSFGNDRDEYFVEAGRFIIEKNKASIGALQRAFRIGFNRAARIMDQLSDAGVVGPEEGTKAREILMTMEAFEAFLQEETGE